MAMSNFIELTVCLATLFFSALVIQNVSEVLYWKWADWRISKKSKNNES